jgi:hypothetical protein
LFGLGTKPFRGGEYCYSTNLIHTIAHCSMLFPTIGWPITSTLAANLAYLYTLPLYTFFSSLYHNVVIQSTSLQHCDNWKDFNRWLDQRVIAELLFINSYTKYIKGVLVIITQNLKKKKSILKGIIGFHLISKISTYKISKIFKRGI